MYNSNESWMKSWNFNLGASLPHKIWKFPDFEIVQQHVKQHVYTMFITDNHVLFYLWWEENLLNYQKDSKFYDHDYLQNFLYFLLTAPIFENSGTLLEIYLYLSKRST